MTTYLIIKTISAESLDDARRKEKSAKIIWIGEKSYVPPPQLESAIGQTASNVDSLDEIGFQVKPHKKRR